MRISDWSSDVCSSDLFEQFGRWLVTDGDESAVGCHMGFFASDSVDQINADQPLGITAADETFHRLVPEHLDIGMGEKPFLKDLFSAECIPAVDKGHVMAVVGEITRLFHSGVPTTDADDLLAAIEQSVARDA